MRQEGERFLKEQITRRHVAVIGDIMLDKYISRAGFPYFSGGTCSGKSGEDRTFSVRRCG